MSNIIKKVNIKGNEITVYNGDLPDGINLGSSIAIDTETTGLELNRDRLCLVQIKDEFGNIHMVKYNAGDEYNSPNLANILEDESIEKIMHFARFDIHALIKYIGVGAYNVYCTKIASKIARTYSGYHGLKYLCKELLGVEISKQEQSSYWGADELTDSQLEYAANDVLYLHDLRDRLNEILSSEERYEIAMSCMDTLPLVVTMDSMNFEIGEILNH